MKLLARSLILWMAVFIHGEVVSQTAEMQRVITSEDLQKDFDILKGVLLNYHPGLYRYQDSIAVGTDFNVLKNELRHDLTLAEAYLVFSRFTAKLKCGHTFCSYYNQNDSTKNSLFNRKDKVPFTFFLFGRQMFIDKNLSGNPNLAAGSEVLAINGTPVPAIIDNLILYIKGDGSNDGKRLNDLNLSGLGKYEAFDIYFPLLYPPKNNTYSIDIIQPPKKETKTETVTVVSRAERFALIEEKYGKQPSSLDDLWRFKVLNSETAYLGIETFVTYTLTMDWKKFLDNAFNEIKDKNIRNVIIDIRGNEGGDDDVNVYLARKIANRDIEFPKFRELLRYEKVSGEYRPYLNTWDKSFYDRSGKLIKLDHGYYTWKKERGNDVIKQNSSAFQGRIFLLVDAANSSATFFLAAGLQQNKTATIIGTETGGNMKGTNGGQLFFLWLPNSKIEIDIPLIGYFPLTSQPDKGITPDILVTPYMEDIKNKKDRVLEKAMELIGQ